VSSTTHLPVLPRQFLIEELVSHARAAVHTHNADAEAALVPLASANAIRSSTMPESRPFVVGRISQGDRPGQQPIHLGRAPALGGTRARLVPRVLR